jgi:predicted RNA binding protein YcfA (HicA-like mRNA interferase family)
MPKLPPSGSVIKILTDNGFLFSHQVGSHAKFRKGSLTVIVPTPRKEIPIGTLRSIARQAGMNTTDFQK